MIQASNIVIGTTLKLKQMLSSKQLKGLTYHYRIWWVFEHRRERAFWYRNPAHGSPILELLCTLLDAEYEFVTQGAKGFKLVKFSHMTMQQL